MTTAEDTLTVSLRLNGRPQTLTVSPSETLVEVLRSRFGLFGCRETCGIGVCGTCTVLVDGRQLTGCLTLAFTVDGRSVETVEGLATAGELSEVQQAFVEEQAFQCSYCTPGFVLGVEAWRREAADGQPAASAVPTPGSEGQGSDGLGGDADLERQLTGHLCRCGCYRQILAAAQRVGGGTAPQS